MAASIFSNNLVIPKNSLALPLPYINQRKYSAYYLFLHLYLDILAYEIMFRLTKTPEKSLYEVSLNEVITTTNNYIIG